MSEVTGIEIYCRRLDCSETTYGEESYCRAHLPWMLCRRDCPHCKGTEFAVYGLWAHRGPLICVKAALAKQKNDFLEMRAISQFLPDWAKCRIANSRHPQKQLVDAHWRGHMSEFEITTFALELMVDHEEKEGWRMQKMRKIAFDMELYEVKALLDKIPEEVRYQRIGNYLGKNDLTYEPDEPPKSAVDKVIAGLINDDLEISFPYMEKCLCASKRIQEC